MSCDLSCDYCTCLVPTATGEISDSSFSARPYRDTGKRREGEERRKSACMHTLKLLHACLLFTSLPFSFFFSYRYRIIINNNDNSPDIINCLSCEEEKAKKSLEN